MQIETIVAGNTSIAHIISNDVLIKNEQDALDLYATAGTEHMILSTKNVEDDFFDLSTQKLGNVLGKLANYRLKLAIIGNFETCPSKTLKDFIYESNKLGVYLFVPSIEVVVERWKK